jgi:large subunit ribosomal protein L10
MKEKMPKAEAERRVAEWKKREVETLKKMVSGRKVVGILDVTGMPSAQFQEIRKKLRGKADMRISKIVLIQRAFDELGEPRLKKLASYIAGPSGVIVSEENPFLLYGTIKKNRSKAPAKAGMVATADIIAPAGETDMQAGPVLAELKQAKIDVKLEKGKIVVASDSLVVKQGETVSLQAASALGKLGITPMKIGLKVSALAEGDTIYEAKVLDVDEEQFLADLKQAFVSALNLSVNSGYPNAVSIVPMIQKARRSALAVAKAGNIMTKETVGEVLATGNAQAAALAGMLKAKGFDA